MWRCGCVLAPANAHLALASPWKETWAGHAYYAFKQYGLRGVEKHWDFHFGRYPVVRRRVVHLLPDIAPVSLDAPNGDVVGVDRSASRRRLEAPMGFCVYCI